MKFYGRETIDADYISRAKQNIENASHSDLHDYIVYVAPFTSYEVSTKINSLLIDNEKAHRLTATTVIDRYMEKFKSNYEACYNTANKLGIPMMTFETFIVNYKLSITSYCEFINIILKILDTIVCINNRQVANKYEEEMKYNTIYLLLNNILRGVIRTKYVYEKVVCNDDSLKDLYYSLKNICCIVSSYNMENRVDLHTELYGALRMFLVILKAIYSSIYESYKEILDYEEIVIPKHCYYLIANDLSNRESFNCDIYYYIFINTSKIVSNIKESYTKNLKKEEVQDKTNVKYVLMGNNKNIITNEIIKEINRTHQDSGLSLIEISQSIFHKMVDESIEISFHIPSKAKCAILYQYPDAQIGTIYTKDEEIVLLEIDNEYRNGNDRKLFVLFSNKNDKDDKTIYGITLFSRKYEGDKHIFDVISITDLDTDSDYVLQ